MKNTKISHTSNKGHLKCLHNAVTQKIDTEILMTELLLLENGRYGHAPIRYRSDNRLFSNCCMGRSTKIKRKKQHI